MVIDFIGLGLMLRFTISLIAMAITVFKLFCRRYRDKELVTAASLFNVFVFGVLSVLGSFEFLVAAGLGPFAILALFPLRSGQIPKIEITCSSDQSRLRWSAPSRARPCPLLGWSSRWCCWVSKSLTIRAS